MREVLIKHGKYSYVVLVHWHIVMGYMLEYGGIGSHPAGTIGMYSYAVLVHWHILMEAHFLFL